MRPDDFSLSGDDGSRIEGTVLADEGAMESDEEIGSDGHTSDGSDSTGDEDEGEPLLEYRRLPGAIPAVISGSSSLEDTPSSNSSSSASGIDAHASAAADSITCMRVHKRFLLAGTANGSVLQMDLEGARVIRRLDCHTDRVSDLSVDDSGRYLASSSDDGTACVHDTNDAGAAMALAAATAITTTTTTTATTAASSAIVTSPTHEQVASVSPTVGESDSVSDAGVSRVESSASLGTSSRSIEGAARNSDAKSAKDGLSSGATVSAVKTWRYDFGRAIKALELDPGFGTRREKV
jgi:WD40 repeat protein